jgi:hypothetical protein
VAASLVESGDARAAPVSSRSPDPAATPPVAGLHRQFGADASSEMVVSWHTLQPVQNPVLGHLDGKLEQTVKARATNYTDAKSGQRFDARSARRCTSPSPLRWRHHRSKLPALAARHVLPVIFQYREYALAGGSDELWQQRRRSGSNFQPGCWCAPTR